MSVPTQKLTEKERRFVRAYIGEAAGNGAKAAVLAGYAKNSAKVTASRLLTKANIRAALTVKVSKIEEQSDVTQVRVLKELARIGFSDIRNLFDETGRLKRPDEFSDDVAAVITSVEVSREKRTKISTDDSEVTVEDSLVKVRAADKIGALTLLCRHLGMLHDKVEHKHSFSLEDVLEASRSDEAAA